jgi:voltage-gated potassium channel
VATQEAYAQQVIFLKQVWREQTYGLERMVRLGLCLAQFIFPVLLIRDIFGRWGATGRKLAVESYTVFKFIFPLAVIWQGWYRSPWVVWLIAYLFADTFVHILHLIFLSDVHEASVSYRRSLLLIFLHYAEVAFDFAVVYLAFDLLKPAAGKVGALYFSLVATTTVGFGDITAKNSAGQLVVMAQLAVCVAFIVVFINYFSQRSNER